MAQEKRYSNNASMTKDNDVATMTWVKRYNNSSSLAKYKDASSMA